MVKISAVVDSGAADALPEWIPPKFRLKVREDLPRRWRSHRCARRKVGDRPNGRGTEPQDRLGSLPNNASSFEFFQDHKGWKSSLLG